MIEIIYKEFNKGQRTASRALIEDVINSSSYRYELAAKHRVSNNKIADIRRYIKELRKGESFVFRGVTDYIYRFNQ